MAGERTLVKRLAPLWERERHAQDEFYSEQQQILNGVKELKLNAKQLRKLQQIRDDVLDKYRDELAREREASKGLPVGPYRKIYPNGRWYAMPGEGCLIMCTWPKGGREGTEGKVFAGFAGYFNECMNGFEYQAAGHMIWEGLLTEGLQLGLQPLGYRSIVRRKPVDKPGQRLRILACGGILLALRQARPGHSQAAAGGR